MTKWADAKKNNSWNNRIITIVIPEDEMQDEEDFINVLFMMRMMEHAIITTHTETWNARSPKDV